MERSGRRQLLVSKAWVQAVVLVVLVGFFVLGLLAYRTYQAKPPMPDRVVDPARARALHRRRHRAGQQVFLHNGLMEYGSVFGHGAYLGPGLHRRLPAPRVGLRPPRLRRDAAPTRGAPDDRGLPHQPLRRATRDADAHRAAGRGAPPARRPLRALLLRAHDEARTAPEGDHRPPRAAPADRLLRLDGVGGVRERPGHNYSYTNNWPPEPRVDNKPTANVIVWSVLSLIALLGGIGLLFGAFGRWRILGWHGREQATLSFRDPGRRRAHAGAARDARGSSS